MNGPDKNSAADLLALALPYEEDAAVDDAFDTEGKRRIRKLVREIRNYVEHWSE